MSMWDMMVERTSGKERGTLQPEGLRASTVGDPALPSPDDTVCKTDILFVATNLDSWEADDIRYGREVMLDICYRQLDASYYAYLRHMMTLARKLHNSGKMPSRVYDGLRSRFNAVHSWAVAHIGERALMEAVNELYPDTYVPPSAETYAAYRKRCDDAWNARVAYDQRPAASDQPALLDWHLSTRGYAVIRSNVISDVVLIVRDDSVVGQGKWTGKARFTVDEVNLLTDTSPEAIKRLCEIKLKFGGTVVPADDCPFDSDRPDGNRSADQQSLFASV